MEGSSALKCGETGFHTVVSHAVIVYLFQEVVTEALAENKSV